MVTAERKKYSLGDISQIIGGGTPSTSVGEFWNGLINRYTPKDMANCKEFKFINTSERKITSEGLNKSSAKMISKGILLSTRAPVGYVNIPLTPFTSSQGCKSIIPNDKVTDINYLYYVLKLSKNNLENMAGGSTFKELRTENLKNLEISLPPLPTQQRIASILSNYDDLIENNTRRIQILEEQAQALYRHRFVDFKFPGHEQVKMVDSGTEFGMIPEGWEVKSLKKICSKVTDGTHDSLRETETGFHMVSGKDIGGGFVDFSRTTFIGEEDHIKIMKRSKPEKGDILFSKIGTIGNIGIVTQDFEFSIKNIALFKPLNLTFTNLIYGHFSNLVHLNELIAKASGTSQKFFSLGFLSELNLIVPNADILNLYNKIVDNFFATKNLLYIENINLKKQRDCLLPRLMSGEILVDIK